MEASSAEPTSPATEGQSTEELLQQILAEQQQHRAEVAQLRTELDAARQPSVQANVSSVGLSAEELQQQRQQEIEAHEFYCPGCGKLVDYRQQCHGRAEAPHPPIEVVPTAELSGPPEKHTAAPDTTNLG